MPRMARVVVEGCAHHVVQRGHNRGVVFTADDDYRFYLDNLLELKASMGIRLYAYCLMTNHVHLLVAPPTRFDLSRLMKHLAGRYTRYVNRVEGRSGTVWEGRYKSSPVQTDDYLLQCSRYIDLNPVRARMCARPQDYPWSSYLVKAGLRTAPAIDEDCCYLALGEHAADRQSRYRAFVDDGVPEQMQRMIREALQRGQLTGNERFASEIAARTGIRVERRGRGRPAARPSTTGFAGVDRHCDVTEE